jgi:Rrf2 family protein
MKLSRTTMYALRATLYLAQHGDDGPVPCSRIAADERMPERFLLQVLRSLVTADILVSTRGSEGGYRLRRPPSDLSLLEIIEAVEGKIESPQGDVEFLPQRSSQALQETLREIAEVTRRQLAGLRLAELSLQSPAREATLTDTLAPH